MGGIAAFLARNWLLSRTEVSTPTATIVAASKQLPFGTPLADDNTQEIPWAAKTLPPGAFPSKKELFKEGRRITLANIESDEPILSSKITGPGQRASLSTLIDPDKRAITVRVDDVRGVAGFILPNDRVDVVLIRTETVDGARKDFSDLLLQDVKVIAVDQIFSEQKDRPVVAKAVTLEVTPQQAQKISLANNIGHLSLILRKAGDSHVVANQSISQSDLIENDGLRHEAAAVPLPPVLEKPVVVERPPSDATVTIVRDLKSQDYKVRKEIR
jgi:pilus assembly protein CpaB